MAIIVDCNPEREVCSFGLDPWIKETMDFHIGNLTKLFNEFLEPFECEAHFGPEFVYFSDQNIIQYTLIEHEYADRAFKEFLKELAPDIEADSFILSLLHELGHHMTLDEWSDEEYKHFWKAKDAINQAYGGGEPSIYEESRELHFQYFKLEDERRATEWGLNYMREHPEEIRILTERFYEVLQPLNDFLDIFEDF